MTPIDPTRLAYIAFHVACSARENASATHRECGGRGPWTDSPKGEGWFRDSIEDALTGNPYFTEEWDLPRDLTSEEIAVIRAEALQVGF